MSKDTLDPDNPGWPEEATLALTLPPIIENETAEAFRLDVAAELDRLEVEMIDVNSEGPGAWSQIVTILVR